MNIERLRELVEKSVSPNQVILKEIWDYCDGYYSPYYGLMYRLAQDLMSNAFASGDGVPPVFVELGVEGGRASHAMLQGGAIVIGVDSNHNPRLNRIIGHKNFTFLHTSSMPVPDEIEDGGPNIAVLHIDTEHSYSMAKSEFEAYKHLLINGAVVLFDDTNAMEGEVLRYVKELPYDKIVDDRLHPSCGYAGLIFQDNV